MNMLFHVYYMESSKEHLMGNDYLFSHRVELVHPRKILVDYQSYIDIHMYDLWVINVIWHNEDPSIEGNIYKQNQHNLHCNYNYMVIHLYMVSLMISRIQWIYFCRFLNTHRLYNAAVGNLLYF